MDKKLSVLQRTTSNEGWNSSTQFSSGNIKDIKVFTARNDKSLNAIPSPFARIHLFEAAFDLVDKDELNRTNYSGDTYKKIISDCFDIFELLYNWNNHLREHKSLTILKWNIDSEIESLKSGMASSTPKSKYKHRLLGETLEVFLQQDAFENYSDFLILKLNDKVIAGSSPFTGFFTTPNNLSGLEFYNPLNKRNYFSKIIPFKDRKPEIKKFIYNFFQSLNGLDSTKTVRDYLKKYKEEIDPNLILQLELINDKCNQLFTQPIQSCSKRTDFFEPYLVKINYRINDECFFTASNLHPDRKHDYLLPLTSTFFETFPDVKNIPGLVTINEIDNRTVEVIIKDIGSKKYDVNQILNQDGKIIDLSNELDLNLGIAIYPFLFIEDKPELNNYYTVMLGLENLSKEFTNEDIELTFFYNNKPIAHDPTVNFSVVHRTNLKDYPFGSSYYQINGAPFQYIQLRIINKNDRNKDILSIIVPKWGRTIIGDSKFKYAIDFGTTSTFVGYKKIGDNEGPKPLSIEYNKTDEQLVALFNKPKSFFTIDSKTNQFDYESFDSFNSFIDLQLKEFLPVIFGSAINATYRFPTRTSLCELNDLKAANYVALSNVNIAFAYEKITYADSHQSVKSNLKWSLDPNSHYRVIQFLTELIDLIKFKVIREGGNPEMIDLVWFSPLSFTSGDTKFFKETWEDLFKERLKSRGKLINLSESEAPFYYHLDKSGINDFNSVLSIDIGGGSTDIVYFENEKDSVGKKISTGLTIPKIGASINFAANLLWSDGNISYSNSRENGILKTYINKIKDHLNDKSKNEINKRIKEQYAKISKINEKYLDDLSKGSDEIINFWLANDEKTSFTSELKSSNFRMNFVLFFSSIIYHCAQLLKANSFDKPTCICFSGNGSKVIDLITRDENLLGRICKHFIDSVFEKEKIDNQIQVKLPVFEERKEATCYGSLRKPEHTQSPEKMNYLGVSLKDFSDTKNVKNYSDINEVFETKIKENILHFIEVFIDLNDAVNFKNELRLQFPLEALRSFLISRVDTNYEYEKRKKLLENKVTDPINDSIFFWPLKGILFDLSNLSQDELEKYSLTYTLYSKLPNSEGEFVSDSLTTTVTSSSIYKIEIKNKDDQIGKISIVDNNSAFKLLLSNPEKYLFPICNYAKLPDSNTRGIKVEKQGEVENVNDIWIVKEKMLVEFI